MSLLHQIALTQLKDVGDVLAKNLVSYCGGVEEVFKAKKKDLLKIPGIGEETAKKIINFNDFKKAEEEIAFIEKHDIQPIFYLDKAYPQRLKHYSDCPIIFYYKGTTDLNAGRMVSIIGTRKPTQQGKAVCEEIVEGLKPYQPVIVSGLAYGIDITAHRKAVQQEMETIGVMGNGLGRIYPATHKSTTKQMVKHGGLISQFMHDTKPDAPNFPRRNKIVAGICDALVVIESGQKGGSMITAFMANDYNKDVFAVPGRIKDDTSKGCNFLIKTHKANLLQSAEDIAYIMGWEKITDGKPIQQKLFHTLTPSEQKIVELLKNQETRGIDTIAYHTQMTPSELAAVIFNLELNGVIKSLPGKQYMLVR